MKFLFVLPGKKSKRMTTKKRVKIERKVSHLSGKIVDGNEKILCISVCVKD